MRNVQLSSEEAVLTDGLKWKGSWSDHWFSSLIISFPWACRTVSCSAQSPTHGQVKIFGSLLWLYLNSMQRKPFLLDFIIQVNPNCCKLFLMLPCFPYLAASLLITLDLWFIVSFYVSYPLENVKGNSFTFWKNTNASTPFTNDFRAMLILKSERELS